MNENKIKKIEKILPAFKERLKECDICPRNCKVNRYRENGFCQTPAAGIPVYTAFLHKGEEPPIITGAGSGTIFFSGCNLKCVYCQNYKFSHDSSAGELLKEEECARVMLKLQELGAGNINLVTPTHLAPQLTSSLLFAIKSGLRVPVVYNTSGYEKKEIISIMSGVVDIYLVDIRYVSGGLSGAYSCAPDYPRFNQEALLEMYRLKKNRYQGDCLKAGLIVRHLVLPGHADESIKVLAWLKNNTPEALVSVMFQYKPYFHARNFPSLSRLINNEEYQKVKKTAEDLELSGWIQDYNPQEDLAGVYFPKFDRKFLE